MKKTPNNDPFIAAVLENQRAEIEHGCRDPLIVSLDELKGLLSNELPERFPDLEHAFGAAVSMSMRSALIDTADRLKSAVAICESPIEARFLLALVCACAKHQLAISIQDSEEGLEIYGCEGVHDNMLLTVTPQMQLGEHRVDFALELTCHQMAAMFGTEKPKYLAEHVSEKLVVECDGHEFHEKTAEQAKKDKSRDRELLTCGYPVMRFTGSEIYRHPLKCAEQVVHDFLKINKLPEE
jgi:hypothetical protein